MFYQIWQDDYIKWDPNKNGNVSKLRFNLNETWKPELEVWNTGLQIFSKDQYGSNSELVISSKGLASWITQVTFSSYCLIEIIEWPFDLQVS